MLIGPTSLEAAIDDGNDTRAVPKDMTDRGYCYATYIEEEKRIILMNAYKANRETHSYNIGDDKVEILNPWFVRKTFQL